MTLHKRSTTCLALALVACGGGGEGLLPTSPLPKPNALLNEANLLEAAAVAYVGNAMSWADYAVLYDDLLRGYQVQLVDGTYPCARGGSVTLKRQDQRWSYTVSHCLTARLNVGSGSFEVDASDAAGKGQIQVHLDRLQLLGLWANAPELNFSGHYQHDLAAGGEPSAHVPQATLTVQSPVSTREYTAITRTPETSHFRVKSSVFPVAMKVAVEARYGGEYVASADDGTTISVSISGTNRSIALRASPEASPQVTRLYTEAEFKAAVQRAVP